jgi:hypothetical protein
MVDAIFAMGPPAEAGAIPYRPNQPSADCPCSHNGECMQHVRNSWRQTLERVFALLSLQKACCIYEQIQMASN